MVVINFTPEMGGETGWVSGTIFDVRSFRQWKKKKIRLGDAFRGGGVSHRIDGHSLDERTKISKKEENASDKYRFSVPFTSGGCGLVGETARVRCAEGSVRAEDEE